MTSGSKVQALPSIWTTSHSGVMIPTFTKRLKESVLRAKQRKALARRSRLEEWEMIQTADIQGTYGQFLPMSLDENQLFFKGSHSPFPLSRYSPSGWIAGGALTLWPVGSGTAPWPSNNDWTARTV